MIRYKDKVFKQYSICPATGDIFNAKTGEVQKTRLHSGRPTFKGMRVHQIMAHTFFDYKPGYVVHHLDENPLNNALSNLVYLTHTEHCKLHNKDKQGKPRSKETKAKISASLRGKTLSKDTKAKISAVHKGKIISKDTKAKISAANKGKIPKNKGRKGWHKGNERKYSVECPGEGWVLGFKTNDFIVRSP